MFNSIKEKIVLISLFWWIGILFLAYFFSYQYISFEALFLFLGSIFLFVGFFFIFNDESSHTKSNDFGNIGLKIESIFLVLCLFVLIYFSIKSYDVQLEYLFFYRDIYFSNPEKIFGSLVISELFNRIFIPFIYLLSMLSIVRKNKSYANLAMSLICIIFLTFITQGRFPIYHIIYFLAVFMVIMNIKMRLKTVIYTLALSGMIILFSGYLLISRLDIDASLIDLNFVSDVFIKYFITYHFVGLYIFDSIIETSIYSKNTFFGCNSLGFIGDIFRRVEEMIFGSGLLEDCYRTNHTIFLKGQYLAGLDGRYNAFGTNLMPLYLDAGWVGVMAIHALLGFMCAKLKSPENMVIHPVFLIINFVIIFGAFQSLISDSIFQVTLIICFLYFYLIKFINILTNV